MKLNAKCNRSLGAAVEALMKEEERAEFCKEETEIV